MTKHTSSIGLAIAILALALGLGSMRATPAPVPPGTPVTNARYLIHARSLYEFLLLDTATGQVWRYNPETHPAAWEKIPMAPGLEDTTPTPPEKPAK